MTSLDMIKYGIWREEGVGGLPGVVGEVVWSVGVVAEFPGVCGCH